MNTIVSNIRQLGSAVRARRRAARLPSSEVASLARVSRRLLLEVETGKRPNVAFSAVIRVLDVLGLDLEVRTRSLPGTRSAEGHRQDV